jgi:hypothetical protein
MVVPWTNLAILNRFRPRFFSDEEQRPLKGKTLSTLARHNAKGCRRSGVQRSATPMHQHSYRPRMHTSTLRVSKINASICAMYADCVRVWYRYYLAPEAGGVGVALERTAPTSSNPRAEPASASATTAEVSPAASCSAPDAMVSPPPHLAPASPTQLLTNGTIHAPDGAAPSSSTNQSTPPSLRQSDKPDVVATGDIDAAPAAGDTMNSTTHGGAVSGGESSDDGSNDDDDADDVSDASSPGGSPCASEDMGDEGRQRETDREEAGGAAAGSGGMPFFDMEPKPLPELSVFGVAWRLLGDWLTGETILFVHGRDSASFVGMSMQEAQVRSSGRGNDPSPIDTCASARLARAE